MPHCRSNPDLPLHGRYNLYTKVQENVEYTSVSQFAIIQKMGYKYKGQMGPDTVMPPLVGNQYSSAQYYLKDASLEAQAEDEYFKIYNVKADGIDAIEKTATFDFEVLSTPDPHPDSGVSFEDSGEVE